MIQSSRLACAGAQNCCGVTVLAVHEQSADDDEKEAKIIGRPDMSGRLNTGENRLKIVLSPIHKTDLSCIQITILAFAEKRLWLWLADVLSIKRS